VRANIQPSELSRMTIGDIFFWAEALRDCEAKPGTPHG
jgi:hypothetical protein